MARVWIPSLLRELAGGAAEVEVPGATVGEVIDQLEARFPGIKARLIDGDSLRANIAVVVDGEVSRLRLRQRLSENSEIHFLPAISGGSL
jgi:sulfur-carrier protein